MYFLVNDQEIKTNIEIWNKINFMNLMMNLMNNNTLNNYEFN